MQGKRIILWEASEELDLLDSDEDLDAKYMVTPLEERKGKESLMRIISLRSLRSQGADWLAQRHPLHLSTPFYIQNKFSSPLRGKLFRESRHGGPAAEGAAKSLQCGS